MRAWLSLPFLDPADLRAVTVAAEAAGIDGLAVSEHVCVPAEFSSPYPYNEGKPVALPTDTPLPDPLVTIAALAAVTTRVRFMTSVLILPLRHPVLLAKEIATASAFSGGRVDLGVGVGWLREEFEALGLDTFTSRGAVTDEMIPLLRALWSGAPVGADGEHFRFDPVAVNPTPPAPVPIFVGGTSPPALRRCAQTADGWVGANPSIDELKDVVVRLRHARELAGTVDRPFEIRSGIRGTLTPERIDALRDLGVDALVIAPWQLGPRRDSIFDLPVRELIDALPGAITAIRGTEGA